jgi:hypothetical protein
VRPNFQAIDNPLCDTLASHGVPPSFSGFRLGMHRGSTENPIRENSGKRLRWQNAQDKRFFEPREKLSKSRKLDAARCNRGKSRGGQGDWALAKIRLGSGGTAAPQTLSRAPRWFQ